MIEMMRPSVPHSVTQTISKNQTLFSSNNLFYVAKFTLRKVNPESMLVSSLPTLVAWDGPKPLAGVPCDPYMHLLAWSLSQRSFALAVLSLACSISVAQSFCVEHCPARR